MQAKLPVLACTDLNTDIGDKIIEGGFGWKCSSSEPTEFAEIVKRIKKSELEEMKEKSFRFLQENYNVTESYATIMRNDK